MKLNWISGIGVVTIVLLLLPNILYAVKSRASANRCVNKTMNLLEQIGRYGCMALLVLPLGMPEWTFAFASIRSFTSFLVWLVIAAALLLAYYITWIVSFRKLRSKSALLLAVIPSVLFLGQGIFLHHWILCAFAGCFSVGHIYITRKTFH